MKNITIINKFKILYVDKNRCLSYKKGRLYIHESVRDKPVIFGMLPMKKSQRTLSKLRIAERLCRIEPRSAIAIDENNYLISFCGSIIKANVITGEIVIEHNYRQGMSNAMNFCQIKGIQGFDECVTYGEYWANTSKDEVSIYSRINGNWGKAYTFQRGKVRHIHAIVADPYRNGVLILTGDENEESGIWIAKDNFGNVEPLLVGNQRYRSCVAFPEEEGIIYATDAPAEKNFIAIATCNRNVWKEKIICEIPGPCIYAAKVSDEFVLATAVEPDVRLKGIRYRVTYRLAQGIRDRYSHIIMGNLDKGFTDVIKFKKDAFPMWLFQFGNVQFPNGTTNEEIMMFPVGISNYDGRTIIYKP